MDLENTRRRIDEIDHQIVSLLNARADLALQIKDIKARMAHAVYDPHRERLIVEKLSAANAGPMPAQSLAAIYREIIAACRQLQAPLRVAYLGPVATFTHEAARLHFGTATVLSPAVTIAEVFRLTEKGEAEFGVVPVENSTDGFVGHTLDMLAESELRICGEITLPITQCLLAQGTVEDVRTVYSHPQALAQSRNWLQRRLPGIVQIEVSSTARAAEMAASDVAAAAIGSELAAEVYGLKVINKGIQDKAANVTRFLIIGKEMGRATGRDKTAVMFTIKNKVGALHDSLEPWLRHGIDMTRIDSRPSKLKAWDYVFFVDVVGHPNDPPLAVALAELAESCVFVKVLGAWGIA